MKTVDRKLRIRALRRDTSLFAALSCCMITTACLSRSESSSQSPEMDSEEMPVQADEAPSSLSRTDVAMTEKVELSEEEWKQKLSAEQYRVLRLKGTERPFTNEYDEHFEPGVYACAACGSELFTSDTKFQSGCGWPAFYAAKAGNKVELHPDHSLGRIRTEVTCAHCDSHLGHIFDDAPQTPTGQRYCINSVSLKFIPAKK